ncbi:uncharacterized protein DNG_04321 [Cephalotrichum gorgonifer]|uniref:Gylcosyl hydrolase 115 C-terminal domain-containing protein n=1 Tax=Cephalotrichum gorgonifer TaxID=2041049 RepID=A0AAE8SUF4_9PEZI|nr:uncharacterized protein DNG_04321 [Cephalotrichum gorgonifer]
MAIDWRTLVAFVAFLLIGCSGLLDDPIVSFHDSESALDITGSDIIHSQDDEIGVHIAAGSLATDLEQITGISRSVLKWQAPDSNSTDPSTLATAIIAGSLNSSLIRHLSEKGTIDVSDIEGKWESFITTVVEDPLPHVERALVIAGSDKRGAIFGIYTLAEQSGQSPYHFFADVPTKKHDEIYAFSKTVTQGEPSVKYRGLFINDEEPALNGWWSAYNNQTRHPLNTDFYAHVFDLLLRLKANYLWPAMWASSTPAPGNSFFVDDLSNQQLANDYGIVISTTHHEPMQRATNEWNVTETGPWDWSLNRDNITKFMDEGIARAGANESYFTLGMRGLGDETITAEDAAGVLTEIFEVQRGIIEKYHGSKTAVPQVWALYKEVVAYYNAGLDPPDDVTLLLPDDNFGNIHRLPTGNETERPGGSGVYFHLEYVGAPRSYKWANTNNLAKIYKELSQAYLRGSDRIWVINVGDIKPMEVPFNLAMDMAWNIDYFSFEKIPSYLERYAAREFGEAHAEETAKLLLEFSHLIGLRRYESISSGTFSVVNYHEAERIVARWRALSDRAKSVHDQLSEDLKPAFYQLVYYPIASGALYVSVTVGIGVNYQHARERRNSANTLASQILSDFDKSYDLVEDWDAMLGGKWARMMSQSVYDPVPQEPKLWAGASRDMLSNISYVQLRQNMQFSQGNLGIYAEESDSPIQQGRWAESVDSSMPTVQYPARLPVMDPYGPARRYVDLFHRGDYRVAIDWALGDFPVDWITVSPSSGTLGDDQMDERLTVTVDWDSVPEGFNDTVEISIRATPAGYPYFDLIRVPILNTRVPDDFEGFPESAGFISIESPHFQRSSSKENATAGFEAIPHLGSRSESGSVAVRPFRAARRESAAQAAWVEYDIYLFSDSDDVTATLYINTCLDTDPNLKMQYSLTLDSAPTNMTRVLGDYISEPYVGDVPPVWMAQVMDQVWTINVGLGPLESGKHILRWAVNSPEVYLEKIVLDTQGGVKPSYLGPPETRLVVSKD